MANRVFNFGPGPATLPLEVLKIAQEELLDYRGSGMSILEISHRSPEYDDINNQAISLMRELMGLGEDYHVVFVGGGASTQFAMIPMNFLPEGKVGAYVDTGTWSAKAIKEAEKLGKVAVVASSKADKYAYIPKDIKAPSDAAYLHITSNNTIAGTQYQDIPDTDAPLICDMSSDILSRRRDFGKFSMIYAGAQKNIGPAGCAAVIIRDEMVQKCPDHIPTMLNYSTHTAKKSLYNTPPVFTVYMVKLVLEWVKKLGGVSAVEKINAKKKDVIYNLIDNHGDYFKGTVEKDSRSWANLTMRLPSEDLEKKLIADAKAAGFVGLKGHRSVGGIRVSLYNAMTLEGAEKVAGFMVDFMKKNPK